MKTKCQWEGVDLRWALIYLSLTLKPWEKVNWKLADILPRSSGKSNSKPTILTVEMDETKDTCIHMQEKSQDFKKVTLNTWKFGEITFSATPSLPIFA